MEIETWTCEECGNTGNTGTRCAYCDTWHPHKAPTTRTLVMRVDVSKLTDAEIECLARELEAQCEATDPDDACAGHPDAPYTITTEVE